MSRAGGERQYGAGYIILPLGNEALRVVEGARVEVGQINGVRPYTIDPHITILNLGAVPLNKVPEVQRAVEECADEFSDRTLYVGGMSRLGSIFALDVQHQVEARKMNRLLQRQMQGVLHCPRMDYIAHISIAKGMGGVSLNTYRERVRGIFDGIASPTAVTEVDILLKYGSPGLSKRIIRVPVA